MNEYRFMVLMALKSSQPEVPDSSYFSDLYYHIETSYALGRSVEHCVKGWKNLLELADLELQFENNGKN